MVAPGWTNGAEVPEPPSRQTGAFVGREPALKIGRLSTTSGIYAGQNLARFRPSRSSFGDACHREPAPPAVGRTSSSTLRPVAAAPVPDRLKASVRGPATSSDAAAGVTSTLAARLGCASRTDVDSDRVAATPCAAFGL